MRRLVAPLAALLAASPLAAQAPVVDSVAVVRESIVDDGEFGFAGDITRALHVVTRDFVVRREVLVKAGQPYDSALAAETERNLRALGVFRRVLLDTLRTDDDRLVFRARTQDGWTTYPLFDISSASGQTSFTLGLEEANFLGLAAEAQARYRSTPDRTSWYLQYRQPRAIANAVGITAAWEERSDGRFIFGSIGQPFLSLSSRKSFGADVTDFDGDVLRFRDGNPVPYVTLRRKFFLTRAAVATALEASPRGFLRVGLQGQVRREDFLPQPVGDTPFASTWTGAVGPYVEWAKARFVVVRNVRSFLREEDEQVGPSFRAGLWLAPEAFGYERNGAGLQLAGQVGTRLPRGLARVGLSLTGLVDEAGVDSGTVVVNGRLILQPDRHHTIVAGGWVGAQKNPTPGAEFDLGLGAGLRAYPLHAFTGDRAWVAGAEYRWTLSEEAVGLVGLGVAAFVDAGGAWFDGDDPRTGLDFGVGLRVGPSRLAAVSPFRIDVAYRREGAGFEAGWSLVLGRGFTF